MKKLLCFILAVFSVFTFCSCGNDADKNTQDTTKAIKEEQLKPLSLNETFRDDDMEIILTDFSYGKVLSCTSAIDNVVNEKYLLPDENETMDTFKASEGNIMLSYSFRLNNIGKEAMKIHNNWNVEFIYSDGIKFGPDKANKWNVKESDGWRPNINQELDNTLQPLTDKEFRSCIEVPAEVAENTEEPLSVNFIWYTENNSVKHTASYKIR